MSEIKKHDSIALILGGHINAYGIARSLFGKFTLVAIADPSSMISASNLLDEFIPFDNTTDSIIDSINRYAENAHDKKIVLLATADWHLEEICGQPLAKNVYWKSHGFNTRYNSKIEQYKLADKAMVNFPRTLYGSREKLISELCKEDSFINVIKPVSRDNRHLDAKSYFRVKICSDNQQAIEFLKNRKESEQFIVSEVIEAPPSQVWSCLCICEKGAIVACWTGRKLSQSPWQFGVFASAVAEWNPIVFEKAQALVRQGDFTGVVQPEFKYCSERDTYFLMEINFRYMMWHYTGLLAGVNLPEIDLTHTLRLGLTTAKSNKEKVGQSKVYTYNTLHLINALKRDSFWANCMLFVKYIFNPFVVHASFCARDWKPFLKNTLGRFR